jgi:hypothetical protein
MLTTPFGDDVSGTAEAARFPCLLSSDTGLLSVPGDIVGGHCADARRPTVSYARTYSRGNLPHQPA